MSAEKLKVVKIYITDNLLKGFIEPSQAPRAKAYPNDYEDD
ncbi:hypothetical protein VTL71DRAFT_15313 [Oculimacula yallundae]|uniref:Uncharacterized protein n=1 Tax=Oculimacula yallundae TaxID=86028 RepID=A0ABR4CG83_9HELO